MITPGTDIVRKDSIEQLCGHRARALQLYRQAADTLKAAQDAHRLAVAGKQHVSNDFLRDMRYRPYEDKDVREEVDRDMWRFFIDATPLGSLMDGQERKAFEESLQKEPPEITPDTVLATMQRLAGDANMIFRRGLATAFRTFCADYKSHDGFKIGPRFLVGGLVTGGKKWPSLNLHRQDSVRDIDRCMHVLDGKPAPEYQQGILSAIRTAMSQKADQAETEYFRVRLFYGNGNAHFYPLRQDLVTRANKLIAQHYGEKLGASHTARNAT
ncbi:MAG TPA: DUF4942 domain-containing protein [Acetobacteraceae bacterium]|jgi:hypothetical protein|nr:DUF4942 domain-containing protein [Acetobacteraceae bacterium]